MDSKKNSKKKKKLNQLQKWAKFAKSTDKKGAMGWFVNPNAGNVEYNVNFFNNAMGNTSSEMTSSDASVSSSTDMGGASMGENLSDTVEIVVHDTLNPLLWTKDNELKPEVHDKIEEVVDIFKEMLNDDGIDIDIKDVVILGSNASYNYTDNSDLDVHIIASIKDDELDYKLALYEAYKSLFNTKYDVVFYDVPVELYVEANEVGAQSNGIYSIYKGWIKEPSKEDIKVNAEPDVSLEDEYDKLIADVKEVLPEFNLNEDIKETDEVDSDGHKLTQAQVEFFKDSKIRKNGKLLLVYHGTAEDFKGSNSFRSIINWFSASKKYSDQFADLKGKNTGKMYECYLNCKKPLYIGNTSVPCYLPYPIKPYRFSLNSLKLIDKLHLSEDEARELFNKVANEFDEKSDGLRMHLHVVTRSKLFADLVKSKGYDSIITIEEGATCIGVFNSNDIKLTSNKTPTNSINFEEALREVLNKSGQLSFDDIENALKNENNVLVSISATINKEQYKDAFDEIPSDEMLEEYNKKAFIDLGKDLAEYKPTVTNGVYGGVAEKSYTFITNVKNAQSLIDLGCNKYYQESVLIYGDAMKGYYNSKGEQTWKFDSIKKVSSTTKDRTELPNGDKYVCEDLTADEKTKLEKIDKLLDKIYNIRKSSIKKSGEYASGNMIFKKLRNLGVIQALKDKKVELETKQMSLESMNEGLELSTKRDELTEWLKSDFVELIENVDYLASYLALDDTYAAVLSWEDDRSIIDVDDNSLYVEIDSVLYYLTVSIRLIDRNVSCNYWALPFDEKTGKVITKMKVISNKINAKNASSFKDIVTFLLNEYEKVVNHN